MQSKVHVSRSNRAFLSPTRENGSGSRNEKGAIRAGNVDLLCILLYLHNGRGKNQRSAEINSDRTLLRAYRFEVIWTFLQGATWILNPSGYCAL